MLSQLKVLNNIHLDNADVMSIFVQFSDLMNLIGCYVHSTL